jgi:hypothetical protein
MNEYEAQRLENLNHKQRLLAQLLVNAHRTTNSVRQDSESKHPTQKRKMSLENSPSRTSAWIACNGSRRPSTADADEIYNCAEARPSYAKTATGNKKAGSLANNVPALKCFVPIAEVEELHTGWGA